MPGSTVSYITFHKFEGGINYFVLFVAMWFKIGKELREAKTRRNRSTPNTEYPTCLIATAEKAPKFLTKKYPESHSPFLQNFLNSNREITFRVTYKITY
ncbi:MAG: hypothetical protein DWQ02_16470 [Bacteroidetes bacterium]|nr:MAG: hypothetical protein DWQ02_16470 [Bacteroidota bacterium]